MGFFCNFSCKFSITSKVDNSFEKKYSGFLPTCVDALLQISAKLDSKCKTKLKNVKYSNFLSFFVRNPTKFLNFKMRYLIKTAEFWSSCKEIFHISLTWFFWPCPPLPPIALTLSWGEYVMYVGWGVVQNYLTL